MKKIMFFLLSACCLCALSACGGGSSNGGGGNPGGTYTYSVLHTFTGQPDGGHPSAGVVLDSAGNLYGTTVSGGSSNAGTVFKVDRTGKETVLYSFSGGADGGFPLQAAVVLDSSGNLYGTTLQGGGAVNAGVVFMLDPTGKETVLYNFTGADLGHVHGGPVRDAAGNLYGTTDGGGAAGAGTLFKIDPTGKQTVLHTFTAGADGGFPEGDLFRDAAGNLYGTTNVGGTFNFGVVFKVDTTGALTVLYNFNVPPDGTNSSAGLIQDSMGNFYGTTVLGGITSGVCATFGCGVVFKLDPAGKESVLYSFSGGADGGGPFGGLVQDGAGNFYSTTARGGINDNGVVFKLDSTGKQTVLHTFMDAADGANPEAELVRDAAGNLYGTTVNGGVAGCTLDFGSNDCGVVFKLTFVP